MSKPTTSRIIDGASKVTGRIGGHRLRQDAHVACAGRAACANSSEHDDAPRPRRRSAGRPSGASSRRATSPASFSTSSVGDDLAEQRQRIVRGVAAGLGADLREGLQLRAVVLHVLEARAAEVAQRQRASRARRPTSSSVHVRRSARTGCGRSFEQRLRARPGCICSKPSASTQSAAPLATAWRARNSAVEPVEQLLLTLTMGMPVMPTS